MGTTTNRIPGVANGAFFPDDPPYKGPVYFAQHLLFTVEDT